MKRFYYRPQLRNGSPLTFYVLLDTLAAPQPMIKSAPVSRGHLNLVINRGASGELPPSKF